jgi:hypothetical protein
VASPLLDPFGVHVREATAVVPFPPSPSWEEELAVVARIGVEMDHPILILALVLGVHLPSQVTRPAAFCSLDYTPHHDCHLVYGNPGMMVVLLMVLA